MKPGLRLRAALRAAICAAALSLLAVEAGSSQGQASVAATTSLAISERGDWSRYLDGRYVERVYRESRAWLDGEGGGQVSGGLYSLEGKVQSALAARELASDRPLELELGRFGSVAKAGASPFPSHRGLLSGAPERLEPGLSWIGRAEYLLSPAEGKEGSLLPVLVEYRVGKPGLLGELPVIVVQGLFAPRWQPSSGRNPAFEAAGLSSVSGRHELELYIDASEGLLLFVRDRFDETLGFASGRTERRSGFLLVFLRGGSAPDRRAEVAAMESALAGTGAAAAPAAVPPVPSSAGGPSSTASPGAGTGPWDLSGSGGLDESTAPALAAAGVEVLASEESLVLRIRDLRFVPDGDEILPAERWRLDAIGAALAALPGRSFLVEGHAAGVGKASGELELSKKRAKRVVEELVARGIAAERLIWRGLGSTRPLASNDSEEGRALNRRVEITVLD